MTQEITAQNSRTGLVARFADRYHVDANKLMNTLKATAFKQRDNTPITNETMMALLVVADQYKLNPFTKEIYAFPDKQNGIVPVVGVDGWSRIINSDPAFDGMEFIYSDTITDSLEGQEHPAPEWIACRIYRKDRDKPTEVREYLDEVYRAPFKPRGKDYTVPGPWQSHTRRMLRHKAMIQAARIAFGFAGIYDEDEAERIIESRAVDVGPVNEPASRTQSVAQKLEAKAAEVFEPPSSADSEVVDLGPEDVVDEPQPTA